MTTTDSLKDYGQDTILKIDHYQNNIYEIINIIKEFIMQYNCRIFVVDISGLNMIDAVKVCVLCSTYHFVKYSGSDGGEGKIKWFVKDDMVKSQIHLLKLDNAEVDVKRARRNYTDYGQNLGAVLSICR